MDAFDLHISRNFIQVSCGTTGEKKTTTTYDDRIQPQRSCSSFMTSYGGACATRNPRHLVRGGGITVTRSTHVVRVNYHANFISLWSARGGGVGYL